MNTMEIASGAGGAVSGNDAKGGGSCMQTLWLQAGTMVRFEDSHDVWVAPTTGRILITQARHNTSELKLQTERADYAVQNLEIVEKARQAEMAKRDAAEAKACRITPVLDASRAYCYHSTSENREKLKQALKEYENG